MRGERCTLWPLTLKSVASVAQESPFFSSADAGDEPDDEEQNACIVFFVAGLCIRRRHLVAPDCHTWRLESGPNDGKAKNAGCA